MRLRRASGRFKEEVAELGHQRVLDGHWSSHGRGKADIDGVVWGDGCGAFDGVGGCGVTPRRLNVTLGVGRKQVGPVFSRKLDYGFYVGRGRKGLQPFLAHTSGCARGTLHSQ